MATATAALPSARPSLCSGLPRPHRNAEPHRQHAADQASAHAPGRRPLSLRLQIRRMRRGRTFMRLQSSQHRPLATGSELKVGPSIGTGFWQIEQISFVIIGVCRLPQKGGRASRPAPELACPGLTMEGQAIALSLQRPCGICDSAPMICAQTPIRPAGAPGSGFPGLGAPTLPSRQPSARRAVCLVRAFSNSPRRPKQGSVG